VVLGGVAGYMVANGTNPASPKIFEGVLVGAVVFPIGWILGKAFGRICQPSVAFGRDAVQMGVRHVGYSMMPLGFAIAGALASLYVVAQVLHDEPTKQSAALTASQATTPPTAGADAPDSTNSQAATPVRGRLPLSPGAPLPGDL
jgi:hypothetical protein